jgi:hypothetical protein
LSYKPEQLAEWKRTINAPAVLSSRMELTQQGKEWIGLCPFHEEKTPSFHIYLHDTLKQWDCHCHGACARSWDLFSVVQRIDKLTFPDAVAKVLSQVGWEEGKAISDQTFTTVLGEEKVLRTYPTSVLDAARKALIVSSEARAWLQARGIHVNVAIDLGLGYIQSAAAVSPNHPWVDKGWIVIPTEEGSTITCLKYRSVVAKKSEDGKISGILRGPKMLTSLYNLNNLSPMDDVYIVEGEPDVWAMHQAGFIAVAYPSSEYTPTPQERDRLMKANRIFLAGDNDTAGEGAMNKLWAELRDRVYRVRWPQGIKDANDFLVKTCEGLTDIFQVEVEKMRDKALETPIPDFFDLSQTLMNADSTPPMENPLRLHFRSKDVDDMAVILPGSVVSVFATHSGSGKTTWCLDQFELPEAMEHGRIVLNYSCELSPQEFGTLVAANLLSKNRLELTDADFKEAGKMLQESEAKFYVGYNPELNRVGMVLDSLEWAIRRLGANIIVLDHLHFLTRGEKDDIKAQADAMQRIKNMAVKHGVIFVVVGQSRKAEASRRGRPSEASDAKGSETFVSDASAVYHIHRGIRKDIDWSRPENLPDDTLDTVTDIRLVKCRTKGPGKSFARMVFAGAVGQFHTQTNQELPL